MTGQHFPIKPFFFPSCSAIVLRDTNIAAPRRYNFASKSTQ